MSLIVQKFGGTSMGSLERIRNVASKILLEVTSGNKVVVVASAMSGETNRLVSLWSEAANSDTTNPFSLAEYDAIVSTGEQVSCALLATVLNTFGHKSRSFSGWQLGFTTDSSHSKAKILTVNSEAILAALNDGFIPIITGFQGIDITTNRQTTLGRGGSDTSAIAIAAALKADRCDIYTDVDGVYTADPRVVPNAKKLDVISYEEVLEMASSGAKVLEPRSVAIAMSYNVPTQVLSSFSGVSGTMLINEVNVHNMESNLVTSVTSTNKDVEITITNLDGALKVSQIFKAIADGNVIVDMIVKGPAINGMSNISFTVPMTDLQKAKEILMQNQKIIGFDDILTKQNIAKVSIIGIGMRSNAGVACTMFETLANNGISTIYAVTTSEIKVSVLIDAKYEELAVRTLHEVFALNS